jgi:hypothetical protein
VDILEISSEGKGNIFKPLPALSCGPIFGSIAIAIDESESEQGQVLLIGGYHDEELSSAVHMVDLATGMCTALPSLLSPQDGVFIVSTAARLPDGRVVCVGVNRFYDDDVSTDDTWDDYVGKDTVYEGSVQVLEPPEHGSPSMAGWQWRALPGTIVDRLEGGACVLSDGRFAVFGGDDTGDTSLSSCEAMTFDEDGERWAPLPPMHKARHHSACAVIGGCVFVTEDLDSVEIYEEDLGRWRRLWCIKPSDVGLVGPAMDNWLMGGAVV